MLAAAIYVQYFIDSCFSKDFDEIFDWNGSFRIPLQRTKSVTGQRHDVGESWGMANNGEWQTVQYFVEGVKVIKCFHPQMLTPLWQE